MTVVWTTGSRHDLLRIKDYLRSESPQAASKVVQNLFHATARLLDYPRLGRRIEEVRGYEMREIVESPYGVVYRVERDRVVIAGVFHGSRDPRSLLRTVRERQ
jgi:addiction module RelE/StbE family toxin